MKNRIISRTICLIILSYLLIIIAMPTTEDKEDEPVVEVVNIPSMAAKAGGRFKPEFIENENSNDTTTTEETVNGNNDYYDEDYDPEKDCNGDQYYHEKGQQCVQILCNFGRDEEFGDCLYGPSGYFGAFGSNGRYGGGGRSSWMKANAAAAKSIGRGMVGRRGRG